MSQLSYSQTMTVAVAGMIADGAGAPHDVVSRVNITDEIPFGVAVADIAGDEGTIELPDSSGALICGIAVRSLTVEEGAASVENAYPADSACAVMKKGRIWVQVEKAVTVDDDVYVRHTANGGNTQLGAFRDDSDTNRAIQITNARFVTSSSGSGIVQVEINLP